MFTQQLETTAEPRSAVTVVAKKVYYRQLDSIRAFAIFMVILSHWFNPKNFVNRYTLNGTLGVTLFYVLSGFLITGILLRSKEKINTPSMLKNEFRVFYIRRFLRIFPLYYLTLLTLLVLGISNIEKSFWWHFFYCSNFYYWKLGTTGPFFHFWSLSVEEQFYLIWPALIFFLPGNKLPVLFGIGILIAMGFRYTVTEPGHLMGRFLMPGSLDSFCLGGLLAYGRQKNSNWYNAYKKNRVFFITGSLILFVLVQLDLYLTQSHFFYMVFFFSLSSVSFAIWIDKVADGVTSSPMKYLFGNRIVLYLGKISYGIYIVHMFIPYFYGISFPKYLEPYSMYIVTITRFLVVLAITSLSWFFFEKPILRLKRYFEY